MTTAMLSRLPLFAVILALLAVTACQSPTTAPVDPNGGGDQNGEDQGGGDDGGNGGDGATVDLCEVVTEEQIEEASEAEVTETESGEDGSCDWTIGEGSLINLRYEGSYDTSLSVARQICDEEEDVSGVGDEALWCPGVSVLYFNKSGQSFAVQLVYVLEEPAREERDIATDIAEIAASGL